MLPAFVTFAFAGIVVVRCAQCNPIFIFIFCMHVISNLPTFYFYKLHYTSNNSSMNQIITHTPYLTVIIQMFIHSQNINLFLYYKSKIIHTHNILYFLIEIYDFFLLFSNIILMQNMCTCSILYLSSQLLCNLLLRGYLLEYSMYHRISCLRLVTSHN